MPTLKIEAIGCQTGGRQRWEIIALSGSDKCETEQVAVELLESNTDKAELMAHSLERQFITNPDPDISDVTSTSKT